MFKIFLPCKGSSVPPWQGGGLSNISWLLALAGGISPTTISELDDELFGGSRGMSSVFGGSGGIDSFSFLGKTGGNSLLGVFGEQIDFLGAGWGGDILTDGGASSIL